MNKLTKILASAALLTSITSTPSKADSNTKTIQQPENTYQQQRVQEEIEKKYSNHEKPYNKSNNTSPRAGLFIPATALAIFPSIYKDIKKHNQS